MTYETKACSLIENKEVPYVIFKEWEKEPHLKHGFTTRYGGVSTGELATLNLGFNRGDRHENVLTNYKRLAQALEVPIEGLILSHQIHETNIQYVTQEDAGNGIRYKNKWDSVDGMYTKEKGITLVTHYADCVPLFFYAKAYHTIGLAHSGWRGTVEGIGAKMIKRWIDEGILASAIEVGIGPSIGPCCFEVHQDVADVFIKKFGRTSFIVANPSNDKYNINLWECNKALLIQAGVKEEHIYTSEMCTCCNSDLFFSHRKTEGKRGTLAAIMSLT